MTSKNLPMEWKIEMDFSVYQNIFVEFFISSEKICNKKIALVSGTNRSGWECTCDRPSKQLCKNIYISRCFLCFFIHSGCEIEFPYYFVDRWICMYVVNDVSKWIKWIRRNKTLFNHMLKKIQWIFHLERNIDFLAATESEWISMRYVCFIQIGCNTSQTGRGNVGKMAREEAAR